MSDQRQDNWQAQLLRFTLFTSRLWPEHETIWRDIIGRDPDIDENRVRESSRRQNGSVGDRQIETVVTPARTDVFMAPAVQDGLQAASFGPAETEIRAFVSLVSPWLDRIGRTGNVIRVAFGAVLLLPADDREASYRQLDRLLTSVNVDPIKARDLLYRINRPKTYKSVLELNRMTTWSGLMVRQVAGLGASLGQPSTLISEEFFARLEIDNSTPAERTEPLEPGEIVPIFGALVEMSLENAARGELP
jgi:hypothetical protein